MGLAVANSYLVHPAKNVDSPPLVVGTPINAPGKLFEMLDAVYRKAPDECDIDIVFQPNEDGDQKNACRDLLVEYLERPSPKRGKRVAERLQSVTTLRSGLGLLFLMSGTEKKKPHLVISRFPADSGILADHTDDGLNVEYVEKVFMKNAASYKSVLYDGASHESGFWTGLAIDRQINNNTSSVSNYWIREFLLSDFRTTAAAGTRRLALALKEVAKKTNDVEVKRQVAAVAQLAKGFDGKRVSIADIAARLQLSPDVRAAIRQAVRSDERYAEKFQFDGSEFGKHVSYATIEFESGAMVTAPAADFPELVSREPLSNGRQRCSVEGRVVDERLRATK